MMMRVGMMRVETGVVTLAAALLAGCASYAPPTPVAPPIPVVSVAIPEVPVQAQPSPIRPAEQWLFGSAEASVLIEQTYADMTAFALKQAKAKKARHSVIIYTGGSLFDAHFIPCAGKPSAVVFDADETLIWNLGQARWAAENDKAFDPKIWDEWERTGEGKVVPLPGVIASLAALRKAGITVVINTNREAKNVAQTTATFKAAGLGDFVHGKTLFLKGDDDARSNKDPRRSKIAESYCVIAMVGDQLGDFFNEFNDKTLTPVQRREIATNSAARHLWGKGWFLLPNSTYGPWDHISYDDAFPAATRWEPKEGQ